MNRSLLPFLFLFSLCAVDAFATHLRAGEIIATRTDCTSLTFRIVVTVYIDTESGVKFGNAGENLYFGDGDFVQIPVTQTTPAPELGENMGTAKFVVEHTYRSLGSYLIHYAESYRNANVVNLNDPLTTFFYIETSVVLDAVGCDNTPQLLAPPIDKACVGAKWTHNPSAIDPDGDSLSYEMITPKMNLGRDVINYRDPNVQEFYTRGGIPYATANEAGNGPPTFSIDEHGTITWDAPGMQGEYNIAFLIKEWRQVSGEWVLLGYVERDMQIIVEDCDNTRPELQVPEDICVEAGTLINEDIFGFDPDGDDVMFNVYSEVFIIAPVASITPSTPVFMPTSPNPAKINFQWQTDCSHVREQGYQVVFKITDKPKSGGVRLVQFKTWMIRVVGPAPAWHTAQTDLANRAANLEWDKYKCSNASTMQIWRRVDEFPYTPPDCVTGMPDGLGYKMIDEVGINQSTYTDRNGGRGLAAGAQYCYRLVAVYKQKGGAESYVSQEICLPPILADAPVITNVTVDKTSVTDGQITVRWRPPFDIDKVQFPEPYTYEVYRAEGLTGNVRTLAHPGKLTDTTFVDANLNTELLPYNYRVLAYDSKNVRIDTSFAASSVRLEAIPQLNKIELFWTADVPWSINTQQYPEHLVYRGVEGTPEDQMQLIANVNVNNGGFHYLDEGQSGGIPLDNTKFYCYRVLTKGAYGNPRIVEPLLNFSQKLCAMPNDNTPPCKPEFGSEIIAQSCDNLPDYGCGIALFSNTIKWNRPADVACKNDVVSYSIYVADQIGNEFILYKENVRDTFYIDANLTSAARCYKIQSVDRSGNKSELSEQYCFDNCPHYELPNVFTPNEDTYNNLFTAFGDPEVSHPASYVDDPSKCAKFVKHVDFIVYDRWGKTIWTLQDSKERSIYIRWNGRNNEGFEVPAGVYYYRAEVHYITVDPKNERQTIKGWVQLVK
jgi:hypothetical protein